MDRRKICSKKLNSTYLFSHEFYSCQVSPAAGSLRKNFRGRYRQPDPDLKRAIVKRCVSYRLRNGLSFAGTCF